MSTTIASASVRIGPDLTGFRAELEAEVKSALSTASAKVKVDADTAEAEGQLALFGAEVKDLDGKTVDVKVKVDSSEAAAATREASQGVGALATAIITLGPALVPITAAAAGFGVAAAGAFTSAAVGAGVLALAYKQVKAEVASELTPAVHQLQAVAAAGLGPAIKSDVTSLLTDLPGLRDLVGSVSVELGHLSREATTSLQGPQFRSFFDYIDASAIPTIDQLGHVFGNLAETGAHLVVAFAPITSQIGAGLEHLSAGLASSTQHSQGLENFVSYVQTEGPIVVHTLETTAAALVHVGVALAPVGNLALTVVRDFSDFVSVIPTGVITDLATALGIGVVAYKAYSLATKAATAASALFRDGQIAVAGGFGPLGVALATATIGYSLLTEQKQKDAAATQAAIQAGNAAASSYVQSLGTIVTSQTSVSASLDEIRQKEIALGAQSGYLVSDIDRLNKSTVKTEFFSKPDTSAAELSGLITQYRNLSTEFTTVRTNVGSLSREFGLNRSQVIQVANANNIDLSKSLSVVSLRFAGATLAANQSHHPLSLVQQDIAAIGNNSLTAAEQLKAFTDLLNQLAGNALSTDAAALTFKDDLAQLAAALKTSGGSLDANSTAGRASAEALNAAAQQALAVAAATEKQTGSVAKSRDILREAYHALQQVAGGSKAARTELDLIKNAYDHLHDSGKNAAQGLQANTAQIAKNAKQAGDQAVGALSLSADLALKAGQTFSSSYAQGIADGQQAAINAAAKITAAAIASVRNTQKSHSPAKVMIDEGHHASTGYAMGIIAGTPEATAAASSMASKTVAATATAAKQQAAQAKAFATSLANFVAQTEQYVKTTLASDLAGTPHQIRSGAAGIDYRLDTGVRRGYLSSGRRDHLETEVGLTSIELISLARATKEITAEFGKAKTSLANLRGAAASVRSSTAAGFTGLGDPSQFGAVSSGAGLVQVLNRQVAAGASFAASLATLRRDHLNKAVYDRLVTDGPQDAGQAALLASLTPKELAQFNRDEATLQKQGRQAGSASANYLFGRQIAATEKVVSTLHDEIHALHQDRRELIHALDRLLNKQIKGAHADNSALRKDVRSVGRDVSRANHASQQARRQTRRAAVAGARV